ncbi:MAG: hypothetical protein JXR89_12835, partial [Deltaproteobacteria bacterium]|nr:hypothetical protein [Deltaproteobacteria bacterium]
MKSFVELEKEAVGNEIERVRKIIDNEITKISDSASDWAQWNDTYDFIKDGNQNYVKANMVAATFKNLKLNFMVFADESGRIRLSDGFDAQDEQIVSLSPELLHELSSRRLLHHPLPENSRQGVLLLSTGTPVLVASQPILTGEGQGPVRGTLVMGRYLDARETARLAKIIGLPVIFHR